MRSRGPFALRPDRHRSDPLRLRRPCGILAVGLLLLAPGPRDVVRAASPDDAIFARADAHLRAGRFDSTLVLVDPVLDRALAERDTLRIVRARIARAGALALTRRHAEAVQESRAALDLCRGRGEEAFGRIALRWLAFATMSKGDLDEATQLYRDLEARSIAAGDSLQEAYARFGFAYLALRRNDLSEATEHYTRTIALFARTGEVGMELDARIGRARAFRGLGRIAEMRSEYETVLRRSEETGNARTTSAALNNLGAYEFEFGDPSRAVELWQRSAELERTQTIRARSPMPSMNLLLARMELGDFDAARREAVELLAFCAQQGAVREEPIVRLRLASIDAALGHVEQATVAIEELFARTDLDPGVRADVLRELADIRSRRGGPAAAARALSDGLAQLGPELSPAWRLDLGVRLAEALQEAGATGESAEATEQARALLSESASAGLRMRLELVCARVFLARDQPDSAEAALERGRLHWETSRTLPLDPRWRERRGALGQALHHELARQWSHRAQGEARAEGVRRSFELLAGYKARTLSERMRGPHHESSVAPAVISLERLQTEGIEPGELLLDLHVDEQGALLFAVTPDACLAFELSPRTSLLDLCRLYLELIRDTGPEAAAGLRASSTERLAQELFGPVRSLVAGARRIVLVPDGITHLLPLEYLLVEGLDLRAGEAQAVSRVPSIPVWLELRRSATTGARSGILAVAGGGERTLEGSRTEIRDLQRRFRHTTLAVLDPEDLPMESIMAQAQGRSVLHVAAHGEAFDQRPWSSRLALSAGVTDTTVYLEALEVCDHTGAPPLTVLSSCASASGRILRGEGVLGFAPAFLAAGSEAVVASLWPVDDAVTVGLMREFYRELARGADVATALAAAQRRVRAHASSGSPVHWAGFVAIGNGELRVEGLHPRAGILGARVWLPMTFVAVAGVLILFAATAGWRRTRVR